MSKSCPKARERSASAQEAGAQMRCGRAGTKARCRHPVRRVDRKLCLCHGDQPR